MLAVPRKNLEECWRLTSRDAFPGGGGLASTTFFPERERVFRGTANILGGPLANTHNDFFTMETKGT